MSEITEKYKIFEDYCCDMFKHNHFRCDKFTWCKELSTWNISIDNLIIFADIKHCPYCGKKLVAWHELIVEEIKNEN